MCRQKEEASAPCSQLPSVVPLVDINAQLPQRFHVQPGLAVLGQGLVAAPLS